jgi:ABC-type nickel/cobalt efflux system permease component RcnA
LMAKASIAAAFIGTSFAWLVISVAAWYVRRKTRSVRRVQTEQAAPRFGEATEVM